MSNPSDQPLLCAICWAKGIRSPASFGPRDLYCFRCWTSAGGDPRYNASCYLDDAPVPLGTRAN
jgi:hypothetical protein